MCLLSYGSSACMNMNTIAQIIISCVLHSLQFTKNIFQLTWNSSKISHYLLDTKVKLAALFSGALFAEWEVRRKKILFTNQQKPRRFLNCK